MTQRRQLSVTMTSNYENIVFIFSLKFLTDVIKQVIRNSVSFKCKRTEVLNTKKSS